MLTVAAGEEDVLAALEAGAAGYLLKDAEGAEILRAIATAGAGGSTLSPAIARTVIERARRTAVGGVPAGAAETLTEREVEVLRLLADGRTNAEIALALHLSIATVKHHLLHADAEARRNEPSAGRNQGGTQRPPHLSRSRRGATVNSRSSH